MMELEIPLRDSLTLRWLKGGNCLNHAKVLMDLGDGPYRVAMGDVQPADHAPLAHCWLETDNVVVDLTQPTKFFDREEYYQTMSPQNVRSFTAKEASKRMLQSGAVEFWDVP